LSCDVSLLLGLIIATEVLLIAALGLIASTVRTTRSFALPAGEPTPLLVTALASAMVATAISGGALATASACSLSGACGAVATDLQRALIAVTAACAFLVASIFTGLAAAKIPFGYVLAGLLVSGAAVSAAASVGAAVSIAGRLEACLAAASSTSPGAAVAIVLFVVFVIAVVVVIANLRAEQPAPTDRP
jgi:hypothetical protein